MRKSINVLWIKLLTQDFHLSLEILQNDSFGGNMTINIFQLKTLVVEIFTTYNVMFKPLIMIVTVIDHLTNISS